MGFLGVDPAGFRMSGWVAAYLACAGLVASLIVVVLTGRRAGGGGPRWAFALNAGLVAFVLICLGGTIASMDEPQAVAVARFGQAAFGLVGPSTLTFICVLVGWQRQLRVLRVVAWTVGGVFAVLALSTPLFVEGAWMTPYGYMPRAGILLPVHLLTMFVLMVISLAIGSVRARASGDVVERRQLRSVIWAYAVGVLGTADLLPAWGIQALPTSFAWLTLSAGILAYAMREHQLFEAPDLGWRALAWVLTSALVAVPVGLLLVAASRWRGWGQPLPTGGAIFGAMLFLRAYYRLVQPRIDDLFLRRRRDLERELGALAEQLLVVHTAEAIGRAAAALLERTLYVKLVAFAVREERGWRMATSAWGAMAPPAEDDAFVRALAERPELLKQGDAWRDEEGLGLVPAARQAAERIFARWGAQVIVPVPSTEEEGVLTGILAVGPRRDGAAFLPLELELLRRLALAVAHPLAAARLYDRRHRLRQKLEEKVAARRSDLARALVGLESAQNQLVQREKMATLGVVVAGVASELETAIETVGRKVPELEVDVASCEEAAGACLSGLPDGAPGDEVRRFAEVVRLGYIRDDVRPLVEAIAEGSRRARAISRDLRRFSRPEEAQRLPVDLGREIDAALNLVRGDLDGRIRLVRDLQADLPLVDCDPGPIGQVLVNLLVNAAQAIEGEGTISLRTRLVDQGERVEIGVRDSGKGIAPEHLGRIFEPFFTTKALGTKGGTGLGLSISYGIVQQHGGTISVESEPGRGTEFRVLLPVRGPGRTVTS